MKFVFAFFVLVPTTAWAGDASVKNADSSAHDITIKCSSTQKRSLQSGTVIKVNDGCEVTVKGGNTVEVDSGESCQIKSGKITCK